MVKITGGAGAPLFGNNKNRMNCHWEQRVFIFFQWYVPCHLKIHYDPVCNDKNIKLLCEKNCHPGQEPGIVEE